MKVMLINKETDEEVVYNDAMGYDTHGAVETEKGYEPVFQLIFPDYSTATFRKSEWDLFILQRA